MSFRVINRVVTYNPRRHCILLVRNKGGDFWYPPGGGWEPDREDIRAGASREVLEETGLSVSIERLLYVQTFNPGDKEDQCLELFWLGSSSQDELVADHSDEHGLVGETRWFTQAELRAKRVFPEQLKEFFWLTITAPSYDPFLGDRKSC